jgi:nucleotide-binding universal stress UspA family protein
MSDTSEKKPTLVGVDGSESSIEALREAAVLATAIDAPLQVVTTWAYPMAPDAYPLLDWSPEEDAESIISASVERAFGGSPPPDLTTGVAHGPAAGALIELSRDARMLVLGSRGDGGFVGMLLGSVSAACAEHAHCPVLVVHRSRAA